MKALTIIILSSLFAINSTIGQEYSLYSNDSLVIDSEYLKEPIRLNLHLPETFHFSSDSAKYPITIIFDSQHERTYPQIINAFDLLTSETQIPETIIIGVPFNMQNRFYLTSNQKTENDSLSGIERMELFLFSELIPKLKKEYKANDFISFIGHSRTAFLVNYLAVKRTEDINIAVALSGFYTEKPISINTFYSFLTDPDNFNNKFKYYYTAGTSFEESTYLLQYKKLDSLLSRASLPENVNVHFEENEYANHMTNFWVSIPPILIDAFSDYNAILDTWFYYKLKNEFIENPVGQFKSDLAAASKSIGVELQPGVTHIFSLASYFGYQSQDYNTALSFIDLGLSYFPEYLDFYIEKIEFYALLGEHDQVEQYKSILREKAQTNKFIGESNRLELLDYLDEK